MSSVSTATKVLNATSKFKTKTKNLNLFEISNNNWKEYSNIIEKKSTIEQKIESANNKEKFKKFEVWYENAAELRRTYKNIQSKKGIVGKEFKLGELKTKNPYELFAEKSAFKSNQLTRILRNIKEANKIKQKAEENAKQKAEENAKQKEQQRINEAKRKAEEQQRLNEKKRKAEENAKVKAEENAKVKAQENAKAKAQENVKQNTEENQIVNINEGTKGQIDQENESKRNNYLQSQIVALEEKLKNFEKQLAKFKVSPESKQKKNKIRHMYAHEKIIESLEGKSCGFQKVYKNFQVNGESHLVCTVNSLNSKYKLPISFYSRILKKQIG